MRLLINSWCFLSYGPLVCKYILSIVVWWPTKLSNAFVFPDPDLLIIRNFRSIWIVFFLLFYCNDTEISNLRIVLLHLLHSISLVLHTLYLYALYANFFRRKKIYSPVKKMKKYIKDDLEIFYKSSFLWLFICSWE